MNQANQLLIDHGVALMFAVVFVEQLGLPLPASLFMLAAGALSAVGKFNAVWGLGAVLIGCLIADGIWFYLGKYRGHQVLGLLCRMSLEPDTCVRRTQNGFSRYGVWGLVVAKFVPGFSTVAPPLAGMSAIGIGPFLAVDAIGSLLYGSCFLALGFLFNNQIEQIYSFASRVGGGVLELIAVLVAIYVAVKFLRRQILLHKLRIARITPEELRKKQAAGEDVAILDVRADADVERDQFLIKGAVRFAAKDVENRHHEIPRDRDVIVYCACPNEVSAARMALLLRRKGITRIRPLLGGIDGWRALDYPVENLATNAATVVGAKNPV